MAETISNSIKFLVTGSAVIVGPKDERMQSVSITSFWEKR